MKQNKETNLIFIDEFNINALKSMAKEICDILNENHKKVLAFNPSLTWKITFYSTFYSLDHPTDNDEQVEKIYDELKTIITGSSPFYTQNMVSDFYTKLKNALHYNHYSHTDGYYLKESGDYYQDQIANERAKLNITEIPRYNGFHYLVNLDVDDKYELAKKYIYFDDPKGKFVINETLVDAFVESRTYYTQNKKQQKALDLWNIISESFKELNELNPDFCIDRMLLPDGELIRDKELKDFIYEIK